jgi:hypothetical protein
MGRSGEWMDRTLEPPRPLSVERIREVLAAWPPAAAADTGDPNVALLADYHRIVAIHHYVAEGGVRAVRDAVAARLRSEPPSGEVADALPAGTALGSRRMAAAREDRHVAVRDALARIEGVAPDEEAAVSACRAEIEAALGRLR